MGGRLEKWVLAEKQERHSEVRGEEKKGMGKKGEGFLAHTKICYLCFRFTMSVLFLLLSYTNLLLFKMFAFSVQTGSSRNDIKCCRLLFCFQLKWVVPTHPHKTFCNLQ